MREIVGNVKDLKHLQLKAIRTLLDAHVGSQEIVSLSLARRLCTAAFLSRRLVGVLLNRKGEVRYVIVGDATRLYLPDIGRVRGAQDRLRGLRLVVARPLPLHVEVKPYSKIKSFTLAPDFKTDLEKLRLDAVIEIDASRDKVDGPTVFAHLAKDKSQDTVGVIVTAEKVYGSIHQLTEPFGPFIDAILQDLGDIKETVSNKINRDPSFKDEAILIGVYSGATKSEGLYSMAELRELARSARVNVAAEVIQWRPKLYPKTVIGTGKLEEICLQALSMGVEMLIFDRDLSPSQLSHITDLTDLKILDRTMLILDIFAQRAVTREGKLQVEMAQLNYAQPRLAQKQSGLSRLTGGIGGRGPGQTKLEVDRSRVKERIARLQNELEKLSMQRELRRQARKDNDIPILAIVGYTNAGKSTLLNQLSGSNIYAKDELFATLDPHSRRLRFPREQDVLVTDTVGFINHLPESLMRAFKATLEELSSADVLIHVVDISDGNFKQQIQVVEEILGELELNQKPRVMVFNKIDLLPEEALVKKQKYRDGIYICAKDKSGFPQLIEALEQACFAVNL